MSFYRELSKINKLDITGILKKTTNADILNSINSKKLTNQQFLTLLSPKTQNYLEEMAQKANRISLSNFGKVIHLYTPIYLSNYCENKCLYCGFRSGSKTKRKKLTLTELEQEAKNISKAGLKSIIILTGEDRINSSVEYIEECIKVLRKHFSSISIEVYPLNQDEYAKLIKAGLDGLTIYQETYDKKLYKNLHPSGPKADYRYRLDAPERAAQEKIRQINIGALLGLNKWQKEIYTVGLHAKYLQDKYPESDINISLPRIQPYEGSLKKVFETTQRDMAQIITALRIFLPKVGINISTRENAAFRENIIPLGVTKMSAGVSTAVGGRISKEKSVQFEISDNRSIAQMKNIILKKGYQPVLKDWDNL